MTTKTYKLDLVESELDLLDQKCSPKTQNIIDNIKWCKLLSSEQNISELESKFLSDVLEYCRKNGKLYFNPISLTNCKICGWGYEYAKFKSGPNKGRSNHKKPIYKSGIDLKYTFVTIQGHANLGGCKECILKLTPIILDQIKDMVIEHQLAGPPQYKKWDWYKCACGWQGPEYKMGMTRSIIGDRYHGICPQCQNSNKLFGQTIIQKLDKFEVLSVKANI